MSSPQKVIVLTYEGNQAEVARKLQTDSEKLAAKGYSLTSQTWVPGAYGCGSFIVALLLCFVLIGIIVFVYMLFVKPPGVLTVTFELREISGETKSTMPVNEKICPRCAESVKAAAQACRFCGHEFTGSSV